MATPLATPTIPVSWGELVDKLTILEIKSERLTDKNALANVAKELRYLRNHAHDAFTIVGIEPLALQLRNVNKILWDAEERVRAKEQSKAFDQEFILTARLIYEHNEKRARIKREINELLGSDVMEEKNYQTTGQ